MTYFMTPKIRVTLVVGLNYVITAKDQRVIRGRRYLFITQKVKEFFVIGLTWFMTLKGHGGIRVRLDQRYDPKGHGDLCGLFDLVYDPNRSRGN